MSSGSTVWGTIPQWLSGVGSTAAFFGGLYVIRRDARVRRESQAAKVYYTITPVEGDEEWAAHVRYEAFNNSDEPIYEAAIYRWENEPVVVIDLIATLKPHSTAKKSLDEMDLWLGFRDNSGRDWMRDEFGHLFPMKQPNRGWGLSLRWWNAKLTVRNWQRRL